MRSSSPNQHLILSMAETLPTDPTVYGTRIAPPSCEGDVAVLLLWVAFLFFDLLTSSVALTAPFLDDHRSTTKHD